MWDKLEQIRSTVVRNKRQLQEMVVASHSVAEEHEALLRNLQCHQIPVM